MDWLFSWCVVQGGSTPLDCDWCSWPVPLHTERHLTAFLQPQTPPVTRALLGFLHGMAQAWEWKK